MEHEGTSTSEPVHSTSVQRQNPIVSAYGLMQQVCPAVGVQLAVLWSVGSLP
jgi:hypothetical protein